MPQVEVEAYGWIAMPKTTNKSSNTTTRSKFLRAIKKSPRIAPAQARRLNELIDKSKAEKLSPAESAELRRLMEAVDRLTFWNVANAYAAPK